MYVIMAKPIGGYRNGVEWPRPGEGIELPDHEALDMIANGYCRPAVDEPAPVDDAGPVQRPLEPEQIQALALLLRDADPAERQILLEELDDDNRAAVEAALDPTGSADAPTATAGDQPAATTTDPTAEPHGDATPAEPDSDQPTGPVDQDDTATEADPADQVTDLMAALEDSLTPVDAAADGDPIPAEPDSDQPAEPAKPRSGKGRGRARS